MDKISLKKDESNSQVISQKFNNKQINENKNLKKSISKLKLNFSNLKNNCLLNEESNTYCEEYIFKLKDKEDYTIKNNNYCLALNQLILSTKNKKINLFDKLNNKLDVKINSNLINSTSCFKNLSRPITFNNNFKSNEINKNLVNKSDNLLSCSGSTHSNGASKKSIYYKNGRSILELSDKSREVFYKHRQDLQIKYSDSIFNRGTIHKKLSASCFNIFKFNNLEQNNAIKILTSTKKDESNFNNKTFYKTNNNTNIYSNFRTDSLNINSEKYASIKNNKLDNNFFFNKNINLNKNSKISDFYYSNCYNTFIKSSTHSKKKTKQSKNALQQDLNTNLLPKNKGNKSRTYLNNYIDDLDIEIEIPICNKICTNKKTSDVLYRNNIKPKEYLDKSIKNKKPIKTNLYYSSNSSFNSEDEEKLKTINKKNTYISKYSNDEILIVEKDDIFDLAEKDFNKFNIDYYNKNNKKKFNLLNNIKTSLKSNKKINIPIKTTGKTFNNSIISNKENNKYITNLNLKSSINKVKIINKSNKKLLTTTPKSKNQLNLTNTSCLNDINKLDRSNNTYKKNFKNIKNINNSSISLINKSNINNISNVDVLGLSINNISIFKNFSNDKSNKIINILNLSKGSINSLNISKEHKTNKLLTDILINISNKEIENSFINYSAVSFNNRCNKNINNISKDILNKSKFSKSNIAELIPSSIIDIDFIQNLIDSDKNYRPSFRNSNWLLLDKFKNFSVERALSISHILELSEEYGFKRETLFSAINIFDRYIVMNDGDIDVYKLKLIASTCMLISSKIEEIQVPKSEEYVTSSNFEFTISEMLELERNILIKLNWKINPTTLNVWMSWYLSQWDLFIESFYLNELAHYNNNKNITSYDVQFKILTFKYPDDKSYIYYRQISQLVDIIILDIKHYTFENRAIIASLLLIVIIYNYNKSNIEFNSKINSNINIKELIYDLHNFCKEDIVWDNLDKNTNNYYKQLLNIYLDFLYKSFNYKINDIEECLIYVATFYLFLNSITLDLPLTMQMASEDNTDINNGHYEDFLSYQTYNKDCLVYFKNIFNN